MAPSPSPFNHSAPPPSRPSVSLPSPSLSPSIASLLSSTSDSAPHSFEPSDYFSPSSSTTQLPQPSAGSAGTNDIFPSPAGRASPSPSPAAANSNRQLNSFSNLLAPDPAYTAPAPAPPPAQTTEQQRPRSSHKRPRPTSSGSSPSRGGGGGGGGGDGAVTPKGSTGGGNGNGVVAAVAAVGGEEEEGAMEPPTSRVRRSSSTSSASTFPSSNSAPPTSHGRVPPPPPPPAPTAAPPAPVQRRQSDLPLEPSVFNVEPIDEFTREVADWLWGFCAGLDWDKVEIEAKVGLLVDQRAGGSRVHLPVPIETILTDDTGLKFQSNMTVNQHKSFNRLLNSRVEETASPSYPYATVRYAHTREIDTFHEFSAAAAGGQGGRRKVRVTRDQKGQRPPKALEKVRVADMNVFSPKRRFDWRVSVSLENPAPIPDTPPTHTRYKDRISYTHQLFTVDLTQVSPSPPIPSATGPPAGATHELEIEFRNARVLLEEAAKEQRGEEGKYLEMVQGLLNNVRMLIRNASEP